MIYGQELHRVYILMLFDIIGILFVDTENGLKKQQIHLKTEKCKLIIHGVDYQLN